jgi:hypothetical protein
MTGSVLRALFDLNKTLELRIPLTGDFVIGLESSLPSMQNEVWKSARYIVTSVWPLQEAIDRRCVTQHASNN